MITKVKDIMTDKGITICDLVKQTGLAKKTIERARTNKFIIDCKLSTLQSIADALKVRISDLYDNPLEKKFERRLTSRVVRNSQRKVGRFVPVRKNNIPIHRRIIERESVLVELPQEKESA